MCLLLLAGCNSGGGGGDDGDSSDSTPRVDAAGSAVLELDSGSRNLQFTISLSAVTTDSVTLDYATLDGTAVDGSDYASTAGTLTFRPGDTVRIVNVRVFGDNTVEDDESFGLQLSNLSPNAIPGVGFANGIILNDDLPLLEVTDISASEGHSGKQTFTYTVTLSAGIGTTVTVDYTTRNGSALAGSDFSAVAGKLTFAPHETVGNITVDVIGDTLWEIDESFSLELSNPSPNALLGTAVATATIINDDSVPQYGMLELAPDLPDIYANPFDPAEVQVEARIVQPDSTLLVVPGFYYRGFEILPGYPESYGNGGEPGWRVRFTPSQVGAHDFSLHVRDVAGHRQLQSGTFDVSASGRRGSIVIDARDPEYMRYQNGEAYIPIGHNVAWEDGTGFGTAFWSDYFARMAAAGENWTRIHLVHYWYGQSLEWTPNFTGYYHGVGRYSLELGWKIDRIVELAERHGIAIQLVFHNSVVLMTTFTPQWQDNPYNIANAFAGGFLAQPQHYFSDAQARDLLKRRIRYLVARWGYSPAIHSWELFNEVQFTDNFDAAQADVIAWHQEMSDYLRAIDPFKHLITTSSADDSRLDPVWALPNIDTIQYHNYAPGKIDGFGQQVRRLEHLGKPTLIGEYGAEDQVAETMVNTMPEPERTQLLEALILHNGNWAASMLKSGAMLWWWDRYIHALDLYGEFAPLAAFWEDEDPAAHGLVRTTAAIGNGPTSSQLSVFPGIGDFFTPSTQTLFTIGANGSVPGIENLSIWLHGSGHNALRSDPQFTLTLARPGSFDIRVQEVSPFSSAVQVKVDGAIVYSANYTGAEPPFTISVPVPAGTHTVQLVNTGADWMKLVSYDFDGLELPVVKALALTGSAHAYLWIYDSGSQYHLTANGTISGATATVTGLADGNYQVEFWRTRAPGGLLQSIQVGSNGGSLEIALPDFERDLAVKIRP